MIFSRRCTLFFSEQSKCLVACKHATKSNIALLMVAAMVVHSVMQLRAQSVPSTAVIQKSFVVDWLPNGDEAIPVGQWGGVNGIWMDEIPWFIADVALPLSWESGQELVTQEDWEAISSESLTHRQRELLKVKGGEEPWKFHKDAVCFSAHRSIPMLRYNHQGQVFERLNSLDATFGEGSVVAWQENFHRATEWPETTPISDGDWYRISIPEDGIYKIDRDWMLNAGLDPDQIDPRRVQLFGNGGRMLPMDNAMDRPLGLLPNAVRFQGEEDGNWGANDALIFWGAGPDHWELNAAANELVHKKHDYSDSSWYFLRIDGELDAPGTRIEDYSPSIITDTLVETFFNRQFHEVELESPNRSGREWFGEAFGYVPSRVFSFNTPFAIDEPAEINFRFAAKSPGVPSVFELTAGDATATASPSYTSDFSTSYVANLASGTAGGMATSGQGANARIDVYVEFLPGVSESIGWLDFLRIKQPCDLRMAGNQFSFFQMAEPSGEGALFRLTDAGSATEVWEVTSDYAPRRMVVELTENAATWTAALDSTRKFVAFKNTGYKIPTYHGTVQNSNIHAVQRADLVIVTRADYMEAAERLASIHADDGLEVLVVTQRAVFDEFSSGSVDPTAIKMLMMMLRDRALEGDWTPPRYLQLLGDGTFANRFDLMSSPFVITYQSENSISPTDSYVSDDYFGFLEDQYGEGLGDKLSIGVGRLPCSSADEAQALVDKIEAYRRRPSAEVLSSGCLNIASSDDGRWRNRICFVSDDMDGNGGPTESEHMSNSDEHATKIAIEHPEFDLTKIYLDAYPQLSTPGGERYPEAQEAIDRQVKSGALIVNYIGHGGERGWSHERVLNTTTIQEWENLSRMPLFMTATCELARFDDPEVDSAGEMMVMNEKGGAIAMLTTTRVVFSGSNQQLNRAFYKIALEDTLSGGLRLGDIVKVTKNDPQVSNSSNKRNFSLLGDVALALNYPKFEVIFDQVPDTLKALDIAHVGGSIRDLSGEVLAGFNGLVHVKVFDKRSEITTLNNDGASSPHQFQVYRNILFSGVASVEAGSFEFEFIVPRDIDYSLGNGRISAYAVSEDADAHGAYESLVIGGFSEDFVPDTDPPLVQLYMNDTLFVSGGITDASPVLVARVFDEGGINSSGVGIGHDIKATLDGQSDQSLVLNEYYTTDLNTYQRGTVRYPFASLEDGRHELQLVVWDVQNNKGSATIEFVVASNAVAALGQVLVYPNPSSEGFKFSIEHNQVCSNGTMTLQVFSSAGERVHEMVIPWHEDGFRTESLNWDSRLLENGAPVAAGVYVYRLTLTAENGDVRQYADQIVVLRP